MRYAPIQLTAQAAWFSTRRYGFESRWGRCTEWSRRRNAAAALRTRLAKVRLLSGLPKCSRPRIGRLPCEGSTLKFDSSRERCEDGARAAHQAHNLRNHLLRVQASLPIPTTFGNGVRFIRATRSVRLAPSGPVHAPGSSNDRTAGFESANGGLTPSPGTNGDRARGGPPASGAGHQAGSTPASPTMRGSQSGDWLCLTNRCRSVRSACPVPRARRCAPARVVGHDSKAYIHAILVRLEASGQRSATLWSSWEG